LLGGFRLRIDGAGADLPLSSQRVIAFVALHDAAVTRSRVAGSLWPEKCEERAAANLRSALWRLNTVAVPILLTRRCQLCLEPEVEVDLRELHRWVAEGDADGLLAADLVSLARSELLPDWYDDWVVLERERVRQRVLHALEAQCLALARDRQYARSIDVGLAAVASDPLRESAHRAVIAAHLAEGNRVEAVRQFERYRRLLASELGVEPSGELVGLLAGTDSQRDRSR
jgi:DNA-binding SARP family transcriptional activator